MKKLLSTCLLLTAATNLVFGAIYFDQTFDTDTATPNDTYTTGTPVSGNLFNTLGISNGSASTSPAMGIAVSGGKLVISGINEDDNSTGDLFKMVRNDANLATNPTTPIAMSFDLKSNSTGTWVNTMQMQFTFGNITGNTDPTNSSNFAGSHNSVILRLDKSGSDLNNLYYLSSNSSVKSNASGSTVTIIANTSASVLNYSNYGPNALSGSLAAGDYAVYIDTNLSGTATLTSTAITDIGFKLNNPAFSAATLGWEIDNILVAAVPEPSTYALLLGLGCIGLILSRRRLR